MAENEHKKDIFSKSMEDEGINLTDFLHVFLEYRNIIIGITLIFSVTAMIYSLLVTPVYKAQVLVSPANSSNTNNQLTALTEQFGSLARLGGFDLNQSANNEKVAVEIMKSKIFTNKFLRENNLLPVIFADIWDSEKKQWKESEPTYYEIHQTFDDIRVVTFDNRTGLISVAINWKDPDIAVEISNKIIDSVNEYLRLEAIEEAEKSISFLEEQLKKTNIEDLRQQIYKLVEQQIQNIMLANVRKEFAFKIIDPASKPKYRESPKRKRITFAGSLLGLIIGLFISLIISSRKGNVIFRVGR